MPRSKILIVDDEPEFRDFITNALADLGYPILTAANGKIGLEIALHDTAVIMIVSDIHMPVMNGIEMLSKLRAAGIETPLVFLTGYGDSDAAVKALRLGALDMLDKPFNLEQFVGVAKRAITIGEALQSLDRELDEMAKSACIQAGQVRSFKDERRALLKIKKISEIMEK